MPKPNSLFSPRERAWPAASIATGIVVIVAAVFPILAMQSGAQIPAAPPELQGAPTNRIVLALDSLGAPSINNQPVQWQELEATLKAIYALRPQKILYLKANPRNRFETVDRVVKLAKRQGITVYFVP